MCSVDPDDWLAVREAHYKRFLGRLDQDVMHSTDAKSPHIDIYQFAPTDQRDYWTLITGGMSDLPQPRVPDGISPRAEIMLYAPEPRGWMFNVMKGLAEMPFDDDTFLHWFHTVPNGMPMTAEPSLLTNFFFVPPYFEGAEFDTLKVGGDDVDILWMIPITDAELEYKLEHGSEALEELFDEHELSPVIDEQRESLL